MINTPQGRLAQELVFSKHSMDYTPLDIYFQKKLFIKIQGKKVCLTPRI